MQHKKNLSTYLWFGETYFVNIDCEVWVVSENGDTFRSVFPKAQGGVLKCVALSKTQKDSVCCHTGEKKPEYVSV